jgi:hypothetical protein
MQHTNQLVRLVDMEPAGLYLRAPLVLQTLAGPGPCIPAYVPPTPLAGTPHSSTRPPCSRHTGCPCGPSLHSQLTPPPAAHTAHCRTRLAQGDDMPAPAAAPTAPPAELYHRPRYHDLPAHQGLLRRNSSHVQRHQLPNNPPRAGAHTAAHRARASACGPVCCQATTTTGC